MKLLLAEEEWGVVHKLCDAADEVFTSRLTYIETRAALAAARRSRRVSRRRLAIAKSDLEMRWTALSIVEICEPVAAAAAEIAELYGLRAGVALHVASSLALGDPELMFASWDEDLRRVAAQAGLAVAP